MSLQFVIGRTGAGKTGYLYRNLIERSLREPDRPFIAIVPEQFTMQTQREIVRLHPAHGTMNIDVVSFNRLAYRVFEELAVENPAVLDDMGKSMVLRKVAADQRRNLRLYGGHLNRAGFISQLKSMLSELCQYGLAPEDLERVGETSGSAVLKVKCGDLAVLYRAFRKEIEERFLTAEEIPDVLCRVLPRSRLIRQSVVTLDGYTGFTPVQYRLLEQMMVCARQVIVTVTADPEDHPYRRGRVQELFCMGREIICRLTDLAARNGVERDGDVMLETRGRRPAMDFIEKNLYRYGGEAAEYAPEEVEVWEAGSAAGEVAAAAAQIRRLTREEGLRYREIAVIAGDLPGCRSEIVNRFRKEGIPCFLDDKKSVLENAMVEFIRSALEAVRKDFDYESMFRFLKCGLAADDGEEEEMDRLENYCLAVGIRGRRQWEAVWERAYRGGEGLDMDRLNRLRARIWEPLGRLREALCGEEATVSARNDALTRCMEQFRVREKLERYRMDFEERGEYGLASEYEQVYDRVTELLGRLTALLGEERIPLKEYGEILDAGFGEIQVGVIPATADRVLVGDITRTRLNRIRVLFFIGVNEGAAPGRKGRQSLLTDRDREAFRACRLELAPTSREDHFIQRFYLYLVLTKPSDRLILSYALFDGAGRGSRPSSLIGELKRLFPLLATKKAESMETGAVSLSAGREQLIAGLRSWVSGEWEQPAERGRSAAGEKAADERRRFLELYRWFSSRPEYAEETGRLTDAAFYSYGGQGISRAAARALYGTVLQGSVTRLERYAACAYAHFLRYGLELEERPEYRIQAADVGSLFHGSIERCFRTAEEQGTPLTEMSDGARGELVRRSVEQTAEEYGSDIFRSSARNRYLTERICRITERTVWALAEQLKMGDFQPEEFEVPFSASDGLRAMRIRLEDGELRLRGRIDRLDVCRDGRRVYVKLIDYKSGSAEFDLAAVYHGLQLQLPVYMDAALERAGRKEPEKEIVPAGLFYYHIRDPLAEREPGQEPEDIDAQILRELKMDGLVNSDPEAVRHLDSRIRDRSDVIPVVLKDGLIQEAKSSVASSRRFGALLRHVRGQLRKDGAEILGGRIEVRPYKEGGRTACDFCPYHGVCGFDTRIAGYRFRRFPSGEPEEIWKEMEGGARDAVDGPAATGH